MDESKQWIFCPECNDEIWKDKIRTLFVKNEDDEVNIYIKKNFKYSILFCKRFCDS